jgi:RNA polymerase sigma factor (sigma-70 family)
LGDAAQDQLVVRSRRGDAAAFAALIGSFERVALAVAFSVTGDGQSAGDVVQDAFLRAWQRIADLKEPERFAGWLCGIVRNLAIDAARARAVRTRAVREMQEDACCANANGGGALAAGDLGPLDELGRREECQRVAAALHRLDDVSRSAVVLRYYENLSSKQIAELLGIAPTAVDMRLMRARRQLREHLEARREPQGCAKGAGET